MTTVPPDLLVLLACPTCGGRLFADAADLRCARCERGFRIIDGIPAFRPELDERSEAVRAFYSAAPFPGYPPSDSWSALRARAERSEFARLIDRAIAPDATVLEIGCGTGQMTLFLATGDRLVVGADLTRRSLELAAGAARRFGVTRARFVEADLRTPPFRAGSFDVVYCSGVVHHTSDPRASFRAVARLARPGGIVVLGAYNAYARIPHRLRRGIARLTGYRWIPFDPVLRSRAEEPDRRTAWIRDQYLHPEEHRHTLSEVRRWFESNGIEYLRTYPSTVLGADARGEMFTRAEDDWAFENVIQQLCWSFTLGREGGLFVVIGRRYMTKGRDSCDSPSSYSPRS